MRPPPLATPGFFDDPDDDDEMSWRVTSSSGTSTPPMILHPEHHLGLVVDGPKYDERSEAHRETRRLLLERGAC